MRALSSNQRLLAFLALSLLLHIAILFFLRLPVTPMVARQTMQIYLTTPKPIANSTTLDSITPNKKLKSYRAEHLVTKQEVLHNEAITSPPAAPLTQTIPEITATSLDSKKLMEFAKIFAQDIGKQIEKTMASKTKDNLYTPSITLQQALSQPHTETRLSDGRLKITTAFGDMCFKPAPVFAQDQAANFNIRTNCP